MSKMSELFENNFSRIEVSEAAVERMQECLQHDLVASLLQRLQQLQRIATNYRGEVTLYMDFAPLSFYFVIGKETPEGGYDQCLNGGLIFHGPHDGYGSGSAPTLSVCLNSTYGWSIHT